MNKAVVDKTICFSRPAEHRQRVRFFLYDRNRFGTKFRKMNSLKTNRVRLPVENKRGYEVVFVLSPS